MEGTVDGGVVGVSSQPEKISYSPKGHLHYGLGVVTTPLRVDLDAVDVRHGRAVDTDFSHVVRWDCELQNVHSLIWVVTFED